MSNGVLVTIKNFEVTDMVTSLESLISISCTVMTLGLLEGICQLSVTYVKHLDALMS